LLFSQSQKILKNPGKFNEYLTRPGAT